MPLNFPSSPIDGQVYDNYYWDNAQGVWNSLGNYAIPNLLSNGIFTSSGSSVVPLTVKGASSQAANLQEWKNSSDITLASLSASGGLTLNNALTVGSGGTGASSLTSGAYLKGNGASAIQTQTGIPAGDITGTLTTDKLPTKNVLQVIVGTYTGAEIGNSTSTYIDTGLNATITPTASNSKILVLISQALLKNSNTSVAVNYKLFRGTTDLGALGLGMLQMASGSEWNGMQSFYYQDSPASTSAITYKTQFASSNGGPVVVANRGAVAYMILMEIKA